MTDNFYCTNFIGQQYHPISRHISKSSELAEEDSINNLLIQFF